MKEIETLWEDVRQLSLGNGGEIERLELPPTPLRFLRDFVSQNKPCIISNATLHWPALSLWPDPSYLSEALSDAPPVSVHLTPNGRADALEPLPSGSLCFVSAHVERMPFPQALRLVSDSNLGFVTYLQQQNDCFRSEYSALSSDCDPHIDWATEALGCLPEAVNLWIGNDRSETSFHKDHYENLYAVVSGEKHFLLLPPTDVHRLYIRNYPTGHYSYSHETGEFRLELDKPSRYVPWCSVNPYPSPESKEQEMSRFPLYFNGNKPFHCTVKAGETLYLPSMWFHHVKQSPDDEGHTIAINYWYDMQFDIKYAYFNFLQSIRYHSAVAEPEREESVRDSSAGDKPVSKQLKTGKMIDCNLLAHVNG
ncbi:jmjC domain-containing protein 7 isoform X1 [Tripterygium wilfordii]|uniref:JmjC domain-containing protein 7 isoform X1 n=1 Tax=Tripterygium wilfordii TaxID=458696 RepID=A0A7J7C0K4_TRIWF|nr:bifunctional peptidase and (3S)-lysyl hydroxylase JMJD7 [Tripterygium wilfordii]KAF5727628.1 jmjC domain-containing protein 7 isoform X1 [Tripterygium wilfordii]